MDTKPDQTLIRALVRFAEADAELVRAKRAAADAFQKVEDQHEDDRGSCFRQIEDYAGGSLKLIPQHLNADQRAKLCDACQAAHRAYWIRYEAFRRRGSRLRIVRQHFHATATK